MQKNHETPKTYPKKIARGSSLLHDPAAEIRTTGGLDTLNAIHAIRPSLMTATATAQMSICLIVRVMNGDANVLERTTRPRASWWATTHEGKLSAKVEFCPKIKLTKNFRRKIKRTKVILGNGGDHCGVTTQLNVLAVGWGDQVERMDEAAEEEGCSRSVSWKWLLPGERLHAYYNWQTKAIFWHLF